MGVKLTELCCTKCGCSFSNFDMSLQAIRCEACKQLFIVEHGRHFATIEKEKAEHISNLRSLLETSMNNRNFQDVKGYAVKVKEMIPGDLIANFYDNLVSKKIGDRRLYENFLLSNPVGTVDEFNYILKDMLSLEFFELRERTHIKTFIDRLNDKSQQSYAYRNFYSLISQKEKETDIYGVHSRVVFVCHSSIDKSIAELLVSSIEDDGHSCWISYRNLPNNVINYWDFINDMIGKCDIFLVISSYNSKHSSDVQKEIDTAMKLRKRRIQFKIDDESLSTLFKQFFDGLTWVSLLEEGSLDKSFERIKERIFNLLHDSIVKSVNIAPDNSGNSSIIDDTIDFGVYVKNIETSKNDDNLVDSIVTDDSVSEQVVKPQSFIDEDSEELQKDLHKLIKRPKFSGVIRKIFNRKTVLLNTPSKIVVSSDESFISGNKVCNIANGGYFAMYNDHLYSSINYNNYLYKVDLFGNNRTLITEDNAVYINIVDDWIYYSNNSDYGSLYKIHIDGNTKDKKRLYVGRSEKLQYYDNHIYFIYSGFLYKIDVYTEKWQKVLQDKVLFFALSDNILYFVSDIDDKLYRYPLGAYSSELLLDVSISDFFIVNDYIVYTEYTTNNLFKYSISGNSAIKLSDNHCLKPNIFNDSIFYVNDLETFESSLEYRTLYKLPLLGGDSVKVTDISVANFFLLNNAVYFSSPVSHDKYMWYACDFEGNSQKLLNLDPTSDSLF